MKCNIIFNHNKPNQYHEELELNPKCHDNCEYCEQCLKCYADEPCINSPDNNHYWVITDDEYRFSKPGSLNAFIAERLPS